MRRPRRTPRRQPLGLSPADETRIEALTVAMALAPGVYARNRMFELFATAGVQRAKSRAATILGIVRHLGRACALTLEREGSDFVLRYQIPAMRLCRVVELSPVELATLRILATRAGAPCLPMDDDDRKVVESTLARLLLLACGAGSGADAATLAKAAQDAATTPSST